MKAPVAAFVIVTTPVVACVTTEYVRLLPSMSEPVSVPVRVVSSVAVMDWAAASGMLLAAATDTCTPTALLEARSPSHAVAVTIHAVSTPLALTAGVQSRASPIERSVTPAITATPSLVSMPLDTALIRKEITASSAAVAAAFDAVAKAA